MDNQITEKEKQMTVIRMPNRYMVLFALDIIAFLTMTFLMADQNSILGFIVIGIIFLSPMVVLAFAYLNYTIYYDRKHIVYRNFFRKVTRYSYDQLVSIEKGNNMIKIHCNDGSKISLFPEGYDNEQLLRFAKKAIKEREQ
ncbi:MAG: hypothetical protein IKV45_01560 [Firmicutes bacterium]|nr:hypothetical protein [Bacillota bacterium]